MSPVNTSASSPDVDNEATAELPVLDVAELALDAMGPVPVPPVPGLQAVSSRALLDRQIAVPMAEHMVRVAAQMTRPAALLVG